MADFVFDGNAAAAWKSAIAQRGGVRVESHGECVAEEVDDESTHRKASRFYATLQKQAFFRPLLRKLPFLRVRHARRRRSCRVRIVGVKQLHHGETDKGGEGAGLAKFYVKRKSNAPPPPPSLLQK